MGARRILPTLRTAVTLLPLAMSLFGAPSPVRQRATLAIVRLHEAETHDGFDPREVVRERVVLTLPLNAADEPMRAANTRFRAN